MDSASTDRRPLERHASGVPGDAVRQGARLVSFPCCPPASASAWSTSNDPPIVADAIRARHARPGAGSRALRRRLAMRDGRPPFVHRCAASRTRPPHAQRRRARPRDVDARRSARARHRPPAHLNAARRSIVHFRAGSAELTGLRESRVIRPPPGGPSQGSISSPGMAAIVEVAWWSSPPAIRDERPRTNRDPSEHSRRHRRPEKRRGRID
jgi:hypothetical protein